MRLGALLLLAALGCNGSTKIKQPYDAPPVATFIAHIVAQGDKATSYVATENTMDYWIGKERIKTTTHVMGQRTAMIRFNAINPATGSTAADLACDGTNFVFVDYQHNCAAIAHGVCVFERAPSDIDRNDHRAGPRRGEIELEIPVGIEREHSDAFTGIGAERAKAGRQPRYPFSDLAPVPSPAAKHGGEAVWIDLQSAT